VVSTRRFLAGALLAGMALSGCAPGAASTGEAPSAPTGGAATDAPTAIGLSRFAPDQRSAPVEITGSTILGDDFDLASLRGRVVVINAWASWCDPCREELPLLAAAARAHQPQGVRFVGLSVNDSPAKAAAMSAQFELPYVSVVDDGGRLLAQIPGVPPEGIPSTVVLDKQGRVAARIIGTVKPGMLDPVLRDLTAEPS